MSTISIYKSAKDNSSTETISIADLLNHIQFGKWKNEVALVRAEPDKVKRTVLKEHLPAVTVSGTFNKRKENSLIAHSGYLCIDIDNYTDKSRIFSDPYTYACFSSVSGNGIVVIVRVTPNKHKDSFRFICKHYFENYGIVVDTAPQNVASLRYVSYDPQLYRNEKSKTSRTLAEPKKKPASLPIIIEKNDVDEYVNQCVASGQDIAATYEDYLHLSFALVDGFREDGRAYFHALCAVNPKYDSRHADKQYDIALKRGKTGFTVGTFYHMLKSAGIKIKPQSNKAVTVAAMGKKAGRKKEDVTRQLIDVNNIPAAQAASLVSQVFDRDDISLKSVTGDPERLIESLVEWISQNHPLRKNLINNRIEENGTEMKNDRLNTIYLRARSVFNSTDVNFDLINRIVFSDFTPSYNPITEYIEKNSWRNSTGNISALLATIYSDTLGGDVFLRKWLIGIIAAYKGAPVRYVLALVGVGRTGKTEWFRRLLPDQLKPYYGESKLDAGKDDDLLMCQKLIIMDDEMGGKSKQDEKRLKELTSKDVFTLRAPYGRFNEDYKRLAILCGTSNETTIINDPTGNTRILTVEVKSINHAAYNEIDKDELFMELYRAHESGEDWYLNEEENAVLAKMSTQFQDTNVDAELIEQFFLPSSAPGFTKDMTATAIKDYIETRSRQQIRSMKRFGIELKRYFGDSEVVYGKGRIYKVVEKFS